jgi:hypothetical protein
MSVEDVALSSELDRDYGCQEVRHVANTMEVLYKVVRDANVAFFAGDVETAYAVLTDTLRLFQVSENKKGCLCICCHANQHSVRLCHHRSSAWTTKKLSVSATIILEIPCLPSTDEWN